jgi:hypothetical protein
MSFFEAEAAKLDHREIRVRFGAVQELCRNAGGLNFFQRLDLVVWPVLRMLAAERDADTLEAGLWWLSKVVNPHPEDFPLLIEEAAYEPVALELLLSCIGRHTALHRGEWFKPAVLPNALLEVILKFENVANEQVRLVAETLLIQLESNKNQAENHILHCARVESVLTDTLRDPLMRRRAVALAPASNPLLPELETLSDPDAFIAHRAAGRLLLAGADGESILINALTCDEPKAVAAAFNGLAEHAEHGHRSILNNAEFAKVLQHHLQPGLTYTRYAALRCAHVQAEALLSGNKSFAHSLMKFIGDSDNLFHAAVVHFVRQNERRMIAAGVNVAPALQAAVCEAGKGTALLPTPLVQRRSS